MHLYCPTDTAILLLATKDEGGVMRFPPIEIAARPLVSIDEQIVQAASAALGLDLTLKIRIEQQYADEMTRADGTVTTVYLATVSDGVAPPAKKEWPTLPDLLRSLPKDRSRLPFMRAWQILTGGLTLNTKAVDMNEAKEHLKQ